MVATAFGPAAGGMTGRTLASPAVTAALAAELSLWARPGLVILLAGAVGAGKSTFARAFIRALAGGDESFDVPSPTFALIQTYDQTRVPVAHADLYRLKNAAEVAELGLHDLAREHVVLVEWPDRLDGEAFENSLTLTFSGRGDSRVVTMAATGAWRLALARNAAITEFLAGQGRAGEARRFFEGDASARRYEVLGAGAGRVLLMDMPRRPDGPPVKDGKPYSAIAHLAEDISAVITVNGVLQARGFSAPRILAHDAARGLALIEFLDGQVYGHRRAAGEDMAEAMAEAVAVLAAMAGESWPAVAEAHGLRHHLQPYDAEALLIEADLLVAWYWPHVTGTPAPDDMHDDFARLWRRLLPHAMTATPVWVLRDYHSPNLLWLPQQQGQRRVGIIDTQDAVLGHPAYDLASLLQDARIDIPRPEQDALYAHYLSLSAGQPGFDAESFGRAYAVLGAQRATKILGIFARLSKRDGKHGYLRHMPRVAAYLRQNLEHPVLAPLRAWYGTHLPAVLEDGA